MNGEHIHVVSVLYDPSGNYSQHAGIVMTSIFETTKSRVIMHIIHDETLTPENRQNFIRTAEKYSQTVDLIDVSKLKNGFTTTALNLAKRRVTVGALYRLFVPEIMPEIDKVIYLDCDIVVNTDIKDLWDIDMNDFCIAGVIDNTKGFARFSEYIRDRLNGCRVETYINSGVMIMNLNNIRKMPGGGGGLFENSMAWIDRHVHLMRFSDQDIINGLFYGSIKLIDSRFNIYKPDSEQKMQNSIIHTPGSGKKTWLICGMPYQKLYWKYYLRSAWGENKSPDEIVNMLVDAGKSPFYHADKWQCLHVTLSTSIRKILYTNFLAQSLWYIFSEIFYRIKYKFFR